LKNVIWPWAKADVAIAAKAANVNSAFFMLGFCVSDCD
jgi:hypothetical protein